MRSSDPSLYLTHILESIEFAESYVAGIDYIGFSENQQLQDAVVRRIEIIGEAASPPSQRDSRYLWTRSTPRESVLTPRR